MFHDDTTAYAQDNVIMPGKNMSTLKRVILKVVIQD